VSECPEFRRADAEFQAVRAIAAQVTESFSTDPSFLILASRSLAEQGRECRHGEKWANVGLV